MWDPTFAFGKPLLQEGVTHGARSGGKTFLLRSLFISVGFVAFLSLRPHAYKNGGHHLAVFERAISMPSLPLGSSSGRLSPLGSSQRMPLGSRQQLLPFASRRQAWKGSRGTGQHVKAFLQEQDGHDGTDFSMYEPRVRNSISDAMQKMGGAIPAGMFKMMLGEIPLNFKAIRPTGNLVVVKVAEGEEKKEQPPTDARASMQFDTPQKITAGEVTVVGPGGPNQTMTVKPGDMVVYGSGIPAVKFQDEMYSLVPQDVIIGTLPGKTFNEDDVPQLQPLSDRVLCKVIETPDDTADTDIMSFTSSTKPEMAVVVRTGPGGPDPKNPGELKPLPLKESDEIAFWKGSGVDMSASDGNKYMVLRFQDILAKVT